PFRADEKYPGGVLPEGRVSRRGISHSCHIWLSADLQMRPAAHAATPAIASDPAFINVPGRTARRTWLRVQQPAANVGSSVGRRRQAPNLLVISMMTRGVESANRLPTRVCAGPP